MAFRLQRIIQITAMNLDKGQGQIFFKFSYLTQWGISCADYNTFFKSKSLGSLIKDQYQDYTKSVIKRASNQKSPFLLMEGVHTLHNYCLWCFNYNIGLRKGESKFKVIHT